MGFTSGSGRVVIKKGAPTIAAIGPGESYCASVSLNDHLNELGIITGYYAKDSFGDEHVYSLITPLIEQIKNSVLLNALYVFGYKNEITWKGFESSINKYNNEVQSIKHKFEEMTGEWEKEDMELLKKQEEWGKYKKETGKTHPEREENIRRILESIEKEKSER